MASFPAFMIFLLIAAIAPKAILGKEFMVGDDSGWTVGYDYQAWAAGKEFHVGDKLVFLYPVGAHNVFKVNGTGFQNCIKPPSNEALTSGNDTITLATPGKKWYICGVGQHCAVGQKLTINVQGSAQPPSMAPSPAWSAVPYKKMPFINFPRW